jgi:NMD protein affecting ribosome stability and mRNA decay
MQEVRCPHCGQSAFATLCTDCQAEGIRIQKVKSVFHIGRCHRCGHLDDEPCPARIRPNRAFMAAWQRGSKAVKHLALRFRTRNNGDAARA